MAEKQTLQIVSLLLMCALGVPLQIFSTNTKINITKNMPFYVLTLIIREGFIYIHLKFGSDLQTLEEFSKHQSQQQSKGSD